MPKKKLADRDWQGAYILRDVMLYLATMYGIRNTTTDTRPEAMAFDLCRRNLVKLIQGQPDA